MSTPGNYPPDPWGGQGGQPGPGVPGPADAGGQSTQRYGQSPYQPQQPGYPQQPQQPAPYDPANPYGQQPAPSSDATGQPSGWEAQPTQQYGTPAGYPQTPAGGYGQPPAGFGEPPGGGYQPPAKTTNNKKKFTIVGAVVVLVAGLLVGGYFLFVRKDSPKLTFAGKKINDPSQVLTSAEANLTTIVKARHGASNSDTRCYFAVPKTPAPGAKKTDVDRALRCGPVLFVDGDADHAYLSFNLTSSNASGRAVNLTPAKTAAALEPAAVPSSLTLERPDGKTPPSGSGGLKVPVPPPADENFLGNVPLGNQTVPAAPDTAVIGAKTGGLRLATLGEVDRYGIGDAARSAPKDQKLIAFTLGAWPTAAGVDAGASTLTIQVATNNNVRALPTGNQAYVVAVPTSGGDPQLRVTDGDITQTLSLTDGKPGASNIAVGARKNHSLTLNKTDPLSITVSDATAKVTQPANVTTTGARLFYWGDPTLVGTALPSGADKAFLNVQITYSVLGPVPAPFTGGGGAGGPYGFDATYLNLTLPDGTVVAARNVDPDTTKIYNVFEVPASFTGGTVTVSNAYTNANGVTITTGPYQVAIAIPAG